MVRRIEVADALWAEVPTDLLEDAVDFVGSATCPVCGLRVEVGTTAASMLAYIQPEGPISLALAHRGCSDSRVIRARVEEHPAESIDMGIPMRWRAHVRLGRPGAMLLWDDLETAAEDPGALGPILVKLGFSVPQGPLGLLAPPRVDVLAATLRGEDLSLVITAPEIGEQELMSFPAVTGGPWIEQAGLDGTIAVVYGRLRLGSPPVGLSDLAVEHGAALAAEVPFRG